MSTLEKNPGRSLSELREILKRQENIIANKTFISKLPDKGEKIMKYRDKLLKEIAVKDQIESSCKLLSKLSLQPSDVQDIEWKKSNGENDSKYLESDDDSDSNDPLAIVASSTDVRKKIVLVKPEEKLVTEKDLIEIKNLESINKHTQYICEKTDKSNLVLKESFKPYKTSVSNVQDPNKEILRRRGTKWEITAATPPPIVHGPVREISIQESLKLQVAQNQHIKDLQLKQASEKLTRDFGKLVDEKILASLIDEKYREPDELQLDSDDEVYDFEPKDGGIVHWTSEDK